MQGTSYITCHKAITAITHEEIVPSLIYTQVQQMFSYRQMPNAMLNVANTNMRSPHCCHPHTAAAQNVMDVVYRPVTP